MSISLLVKVFETCGRIRTKPLHREGVPWISPKGGQGTAGNEAFVAEI